MKKPSLISFFFFFSICRIMANDSTAVFPLREIPHEGLTLNKHWLYRPGDDPSWRSVELDDKNWQPADPTDELHHVPLVRDAEIGWFRLKFGVDPAMRNRTVAFIYSGIGASEIYLNGKLIYRFGEVSKTHRDEETRFFRNNLLSLRLDSQAVQVLAIRHSFHKKNLYLKFTAKRPIAEIVLKEIGPGFSDHIKSNNLDATLRSIQVSFYLPLGFLLLFLFLSFRLQKEYLYSGIFCFCMFAAILLHIFALSEPTPVTRSNYLLYTTQVLYIVGALSFLKAIYVLFNKKRSVFVYFIVLYGITSLFLYFFNYDLSGLFNAVFFPLINLEFLRLSWQAFRKKRQGASILFITSLLLNLSLVLYVVFTIGERAVASAYLQSISFIIPGIGLSLFFAGEFARTASSLRQRAIEVEQLSQEKLAQEKEKQLLLTAHNELLEKEVAERTQELSHSLNELKETQSILVQREKMASLGELTAGIAHEIQNPLNFVNNFSDLNAELIEEMMAEAEKGRTESVRSMAQNIRENFQKILQHGKRADGIVKSMLLHSRHGGVKEFTDINSLIDEYFRLAFHGIKAKDKNFSAVVQSEYDPAVGILNVVPQDFGRVIMNLLTNAFYAVTEKKAHSPEGYQPTVKVKTIRNPDTVEIYIADNGSGIPSHVMNKIFQPFFTTKPSGKGTGLGLSMSYDIIKSHGGELKVETKEGEGTTFIIQIPVNQPPL